MTAYVYDPSDINLDWGGVPITGFSDGAFIVINFVSPQWNVTEGIDGNTAFSPKTSLGGTCTVNLQQGSAGNQVLTQALSDQDGNVGNLIQGMLTLSEPSGTYNLEFKDAIIQNQPSVSYGMMASDGPREWIFYSPNISYLATVNKVNRGESTLSRLIRAIF
jgi:hypothetical protein